MTQWKERYRMIKNKIEHTRMSSCRNRRHSNSALESKTENCIILFKASISVILHNHGGRRDTGWSRRKWKVYAEYITSTSRRTWMVNWKRFPVKWKLPNFGNIPEFSWRDWGTLRKTPEQQCPGPDSNRTPQQYGTVALPLQETAPQLRP
jgi:hypothetical protein